MKKTITLILITVTLGLYASCKDDGGTSEMNLLPFLAQQPPVGDATLTVKATYNGTLKAGVPNMSDGTGKIFVYLYNSLGTTTRTPAKIYSGSSDAAVAVGTEYDITITGIVDGQYYVMVFYDYKGGDNFDNKTDRYILYNNTQYVGGASKLAVSGDTELADITFGDTYQLQDNSAFIPDPATYSLTVHATYNGAGTSGGSGKMYAYLYNSLGTGTRTPASPVYTGATPAAATPGTEYAITISDIIPGSYNLVLLYDQAAANGDSEGDPYMIFNGTPYTGNSSKVTISANVDLPGVVFTDTNKLQAGSLYLVTASTYTLTVTATYTGTVKTDGTGKVYVYLYNMLGAATDTYAPVYTGSTAGEVPPGGVDPGTVTISGIIPGDYYVMAFYDYKLHATPEGKDDRYILYNGKGLVNEASKLTISADAPLSVSFGDTYKLQTAKAFVQPGSLTVTATYNGAEPPACGEEPCPTKKIYVYLFTSRPTKSNSPTPAYTACTDAAVTPTVPADIVFSSVAPGDYFVLIFYDYAGGATPDNQGDPYELYSDTGSKAAAITKTIAGAGETITGVEFDATWTILSSKGLNP